jgi:ElaB/YqjD/DUF883 family membrane-anchored ribosome-binding protein
MRWRNFRRGMKDAWPAWLALGGIAAGAGLGILTGAILPPTWGHFAAGYLQLAGLSVVALGVASKVGITGKSILARVRDWFRRTFLKPQPAHIGMGAVSAAGILSGKASFRAGIKEDAPLDAQVAALWKELRRAQDQMDSLETKLENAAGELRREIEQEASERKEADAAIRADQVRIHVGGWEWEAVGVVWVAVGIVLGTFF